MPAHPELGEVPPESRVVALELDDELPLVVAAAAVLAEVLAALDGPQTLRRRVEGKQFGLVFRTRESLW